MLDWDIFFILIMLGLTSWFIPGIAGGTITAVVIKWADTRIHYARLLLIAFGWIAGMVVGGIAGTLLYQSFYEVKSLLGDFDYQLPLTISFAVTGMITALIGSWTTYKVLESTVTTEDAG